MSIANGVARVTGALVAVLVAACSNAAGTEPATWSAVHKVEVTDPQYQMTAFTVGVPTNWKFAGEVVRSSGCHGDGPGLKSTSASPDGNFVIVHFPGFTWTLPSGSAGAQRQGPVRVRCSDMNIQSAADFLTKLAAPNLGPKTASVTSLSLPADIQATLAQQQEKAQQVATSLAERFHQQPTKIRIDGARVKLAYSVNGKPVEEMLQTIIDCRDMTMPGMGPMPAFSNNSCTARNILVIRAPQGQLDRWMDSPAVTALNRVTAQNQEWAQRVQQDRVAAFQAQGRALTAQGDANLKANQTRFNAMIENNQAQTDARTQRWQNAMNRDAAQQAAIDDAAHRTALRSLDRQDFTNPTTGQTVEADANYNHQFMSSDGKTLIQTDDHTFDPARQVSTVISESWTELTPK